MTRSTRASIHDGLRRRASDSSCSSIPPRASMLSRRSHIALMSRLEIRSLPMRNVESFQCFSRSSVHGSQHQRISETYQATARKAVEMPDKITYYAVIGGDRTVDNPYGL